MISRPLYKIGFCLFIASILITSAIFLATLLNSPLLHYMDFTGWLYYLPSVIGHATVLSIPAYLIYNITLKLSKSFKATICLYFFLSGILQTILLLNGYVFNIYRFHINGFVLQLVLGAGSDIFVFDGILIIKFLAIILGVIGIPYFLFYKIANKLAKRVSKKFILSCSCLLLTSIVVAHIGHAVAASTHQVSIQKSATSLPYFYPLTMNSFLKKLGIAESDNFSNVEQVEYQDILYPKNSLVLQDSIPNYNIVYILIDSWNPTTFNSQVTPNLSCFSDKAITYNNHFSSSSGTRGSLFGLFFGAPLAYRKDFTLSHKSPIIIEQLINRNYDIQVFPSANFSTPPFDKDLFGEVPNIITQVEGSTPFERDSTITKLSIDYIKNHDKSKPFYSLIFYDTAHAMAVPQDYALTFKPSWISANYLALNNDLDRTPFFNLYKNCVHYIDKLVGSVINELQANDLLKNTVVVITGDHGQEFNENKKNYWGHGSNYSKWQTQIPLIVYYPGVEHTSYEHMTTHYDISATIAKRYLGIQNDFADITIGTDLNDTTSRYPHNIGDDIGYGFIFNGRIAQTNHLGTMEVFDEQMNEIDISSISHTEISKAIQKKNHFYN